MVHHRRSFFAVLLCMLDAHAWTQPFHWTADGARYARQVCRRPGCRHVCTYPVPRSHRINRHRRVSHAGLAVAVLVGAAHGAFGGSFTAVLHRLF